MSESSLGVYRISYLLAEKRIWVSYRKYVLHKLVCLWNSFGSVPMTKNTEAAAAVAKMSPQMFKPEPPSTVCLMHTMSSRMSSRAKLEKTGSGGLRRDLQTLCLKVNCFTLTQEPSSSQVLPQYVLAFVSLMTLGMGHTKDSRL